MASYHRDTFGFHKFRSAIPSIRMICIFSQRWSLSRRVCCHLVSWTATFALQCCRHDSCCPGEQSLCTCGACQIVIEISSCVVQNVQTRRLTNRERADSKLMCDLFLNFCEIFVMVNNSKYQNYKRLKVQKRFETFDGISLKIISSSQNNLSPKSIEMFMWDSNQSAAIAVELCGHQKQNLTFSLIHSIRHVMCSMCDLCALYLSTKFKLTKFMQRTTNKFEIFKLTIHNQRSK